MSDSVAFFCGWLARVDSRVANDKEERVGESDGDGGDAGAVGQRDG